MIRRFTTPALVACLLIGFAGCETWPVAAARAAKKRESQTGPIMGELEQAADVEDPLGRKQVDIDEEAGHLDQKATGIGSRVENLAEDL